VPGRFRWDSPDELIFSPARPLDPATSYTANVSNTVLRYTKFGKVEGADKISFRTPDLRLDNAQTLWVGESATSAVPQVELLFNYRISPTEIQEKLKIRSGGSEIPYTLITSGEDNKMV